MSLRKSINGKCKDCIYDDLAAGTWLQQVTLCPDDSCPLYDVRPQSKSRIPDNVLSYYGIKSIDSQDLSENSINGYRKSQLLSPSGQNGHFSGCGGMNKSRRKSRIGGGSFVALPHVCLMHENFTALSAHAVKLLIDLYASYRGINNGDLCCTWSLMKKRGWRSESTLNNARKELLYYGWIICSRQGGRNMPSLYAVTFQSIDECEGKLDVRETAAAPRNWKEPKQYTWKEWQKNKSLLRNVVQLTTLPVVTREETACLVM